MNEDYQPDLMLTAALKAREDLSAFSPLKSAANVSRREFVPADESAGKEIDTNDPVIARHNDMMKMLSRIVPALADATVVDPRPSADANYFTDRVLPDLANFALGITVNPANLALGLASGAVKSALTGKDQMGNVNVPMAQVTPNPGGMPQLSTPNVPVSEAVGEMGKSLMAPFTAVGKDLPQAGIEGYQKAGFEGMIDGMYNVTAKGVQMFKDYPVTASAMVITAGGMALGALPKTTMKPFLPADYPTFLSEEVPKVLNGDQNYAHVYLDSRQPGFAEKRGQLGQLYQAAKDAGKKLRTVRSKDPNNPGLNIAIYDDEVLSGALESLGDPKGTKGFVSMMLQNPERTGTQYGKLVIEPLRSGNTIVIDDAKGIQPSSILSPGNFYSKIHWAAGRAQKALRDALLVNRSLGETYLAWKNNYYEPLKQQYGKDYFGKIVADMDKKAGEMGPQFDFDQELRAYPEETQIALRGHRDLMNHLRDRIKGEMIAQGVPEDIATEWGRDGFYFPRLFDGRWEISGVKPKETISEGGPPSPQTQVAPPENVPFVPGQQALADAREITPSVLTGRRAITVFDKYLSSLEQEGLATSDAHDFLNGKISSGDLIDKYFPPSEMDPNASIRGTTHADAMEFGRADEVKRLDGILNQFRAESKPVPGQQALADARGKSDFITRAETKGRAFSILKKLKRDGYTDLTIAADNTIPAAIAARLPKGTLERLIASVSEKSAADRETILDWFKRYNPRADAETPVIAAKETKKKGFRDIQGRTTSPVTGKEYEFWNTDYDKVMDSYVNGASRYLAMNQASRNFWKWHGQIPTSLSNVRSGLEDLLGDVMGRRYKVSEAVDAHLSNLLDPLNRHLEKRGMRLDFKPMALERWTGAARTVTANIKLGTPAAAMTNALQTFQTLWPRVSTADFISAWKDSYTDAAWTEAREAGILGLPVKFEGVHLGKAGQETQRGLLWGFSKTEQRNRVVAYVAGKRQAQSPHGRYMAAKMGYGPNDPEFVHNYAVDMVSQTQFDMSAADLPKIFKGPIARTLFQFKPFQLKFIEGVADLKNQPSPLKSYAKFASAQMMAGGVKTLMSPVKMAAGYGILKLYHEIRDEAGEETADAFVYGFPGLLKMDMSGRLGLDIFPTFGSTPEERIVNYLAGPTVSDIFQAGKQLVSDPKDQEAWFGYLKSHFPQIKMGTSLWSLIRQDQYLRDRRGKSLTPASPVDHIIESLGFSSVKRATAYDAKYGNFRPGVLPWISDEDKMLKGSFQGYKSGVD